MGYERSVACLCLVALLAGSQVCESQKLPDYVDRDQCGALSLDALVHQRMIPNAGKALQGLKSFAQRALDLTLESVQQLMSQLPGRDASDNQDLQVHNHFALLKKRLDKFVSKATTNLTLTWEDVLVANNGFLNRTEETTGPLLAAIQRTTATYQTVSRATRRQLAAILLEPVKELLKRSGQALGQLSQDRKILDDVMPNFIGRLTGQAMETGIDLEVPVVTLNETRVSLYATAKERRLVLSEELFQVNLLQSELGILLSRWRCTSPERLELTRRDLAMHWAHETQNHLAEKAKVKEQEMKKKIPDPPKETLLETEVLSLIQLYS